MIQACLTATCTWSCAPCTCPLHIPYTTVIAHQHLLILAQTRSITGPSHRAGLSTDFGYSWCYSHSWRNRSHVNVQQCPKNLKLFTLHDMSTKIEQAHWPELETMVDHMSGPRLDHRHATAACYYHHGWQKYHSFGQVSLAQLCINEPNQTKQQMVYHFS